MIKFETRWKMYKKIALACSGLILFQSLFPTVAWALTSGPSQPEFSSFEPVSTTSMVNDFSGDFTYNIPVLQIPGLEGGGYALSLSYHSGASPEEEASWVGYGWTLNPGAINRQKKGYPDDWDGEDVKTWNKTRANATVSLGGHIGNFEGYSSDVPINASATLRYNNNRGFGYGLGLGYSLVNGLISLGYNYSDGQGSFSLSVNPAAMLSVAKKNGEKELTAEQKKERDKTFLKYRKEGGKGNQQDYDKMNVGGSPGSTKNSMASKLSFQMLQQINFPSSTTKYTGVSVNGSASAQFNVVPNHIGFNAGFSAGLSMQKNDDSNLLPAYGYMYSEHADDESLMDYTMENDLPYEKRDKFLPVPFNSADYFAASGEALGGGFRMHKQKVGYYRPNKVTSLTAIGNISLELSFGPMHVSGGIDRGVGAHWLKTEGWNHETSEFSGQDLDSVTFRFQNDMGGYLFASDDELEQANLQPSTQLAALINPNSFIYDVATIGSKGFIPNSNAILNTVNEGERVRRSTFIGYNKNVEMADTHNGINYKAYNKDASIEDFIDRTSGIANQIGEYSIVNTAGQRYNYSLPVYSRKEKQLSFDPANSSSVEHNHIVYKNTSGSNNIIKTGQESDAPYASTYLLTSILDEDYIDRTNNGPTSDDFGGWTRFSYKRMYGSDDKTSGSGWYKWRDPYTGHTYARNSFSDPDDDIIAYSEGEKEIYYLDTIHTRTHVAVFNTSTRSDGVDAGTNAGNNPNSQGSGVLQQLDKIELYAKGFNGELKLIQTTHFEYSNELMMDVPNSLSGEGKLTLKKVWFEYEGTKPAWINPYEFDYEYPTPDYPDPYNSFENYGNGLAENPNYDRFNLDAWGNYQANGQARFDSYIKWLDQTPSTSFDPAAWQLKKIKLPSGGEIHVQYEQDDYQYVQDRSALSMVSLAGSENVESVSSNKFYLNHEEIGVSNTELTDLLDLIDREFIQTGERIYFKFLYKLLGNQIPDIEDCNVDFVDGYLEVADAGISNYGGTDRIWLRLGKSGSDFNLPRKICRDFVRTQRSGKLSHNDCMDDQVFGDSPNLGISLQDAYQFFLNFSNFLYGNLIPNNRCNKMNHGYSYIRIPNLHPKKGGGIRVKRLMMFDDGSTTGKKVLYGKQYTYEVFDEQRNQYISSGVATNEPTSIREENALVRFLPRFKQSMASKVVAGKDRKQTEGPIGESVLPGPSVGYAKVIVEDIHSSNETGSGFVTKEFYTAREYPVTYEMTTIKETKDILTLPAILINKFVTNSWMTQGFKFETNGMHGTPASEKWYAGLYEQDEALNNPLVQSTVHEYYEPGESIPVMTAFNEINYQEPLGQEIDISMESKQVREESVNGNIELDAGVQFFPNAIPPFLPPTVPIPFSSGMGSLTHTKNELYTHVTSKIVSYPVVQKSTTSFREGVYHKTEHLAYSHQTGEPLITETTDGFEYHDESMGNVNLAYSSNHNGKYTAYTIPVWTEFDSFDQKAKNERSEINGDDLGLLLNKISATQINFTPSSSGPSGSICDAMSNFGPGDLIEIRSVNGSSKEVAYVTALEGNNLVFDRAYYSSASISTNTEVILRVLRSGKNNRISEASGHFTTYGESQTVDLPTPTSVSSPRQSFANQLNNFIMSASSGQHFAPTGSAAENEFFFDPLAAIDCQVFESGTIDIQYVSNGSTFSLHVYMDPGQYNQYTQNEFGCYGVIENQPIINGDWGQFALDPKTNLLVYYPAGNDCFPVTLSCFQFCDAHYPGLKISNVVSSDAVVHADDWEYDLAAFPDWSSLSNRGVYEMGTKGKWRPESVYSYNDESVDNVALPFVASNSNKNYNTGTYTMDYFNWAHPAGNGVFWQKDATITEYSPDGHGTQETNILGINSAAMYGYKQRRPTMIVQNSDLYSSYFEPFECNYGTYTTPYFERQAYDTGFANFLEWDTTIAHSGTSSARLDATDISNYPSGNEHGIYHMPDTWLSNEIKEQGLEVRFWIKHPVEITNMDFRVKVFTNPNNLTQIDWPPGGDIKMIARAGEWDLYQGELDASIFSSYGVGEVFFDPVIYIYRGGSYPNDFLEAGDLWIDDIIITPKQAGAACHVYDKETFKVTASFNDAHFATFYQYNDEGHLIRKIIETEKGKKTLQEATYNSPQVLK